MKYVSNLYKAQRNMSKLKNIQLRYQCYNVVTKENETRSDALTHERQE